MVRAKAEVRVVNPRGGRQILQLQYRPRQCVQGRPRLLHLLSLRRLALGGHPWLPVAADLAWVRVTLPEIRMRAFLTTPPVFLRRLVFLPGAALSLLPIHATMSVVTGSS